MYVTRKEKGMFVKKTNEKTQELRLWVIMDPPPPTLGINCHGVGGQEERRGGVVTVKVGEESDEAAVIYKVIQDRFHWCQRG